MTATGISAVEGFLPPPAPQYRAAGDNLFKYHVDLPPHLPAGDSIGALCVSRPPTHPATCSTARTHPPGRHSARPDIPLIVDGALACRFPEYRVQPGQTTLEPQHHFSPLSPVETGPAGVRTSIIVAREDIIRAYTNATSSACPVATSAPRWRPAVCQRPDAAAEPHQVTPSTASARTRPWTGSATSSANCPFISTSRKVLSSCGWFEAAHFQPELYQRLKTARGACPRAQFFVGITEDWPRTATSASGSPYAGEPQRVKPRGVELIAEEVARPTGQRQQYETY